MFVLIVEAPAKELPQYIGPFETDQAAWRYAQGWCAGTVVTGTRMMIGTSWHVASLEAPGEWLEPWHENLVISSASGAALKKTMDQTQ
jgi:hypothetical protein